MTDANKAPRRVSMAYILGFSHKPFKDGGPPIPAPPPPPRQPSNFKQMVSTPGGVIEWAASDGRRGRLTGPGKPRLTAAGPLPAHDAKIVVDNHPGNDDGVLGMMSPFGEAVAPTAAAASAKGEDSANSGWTKDQDEKLLELRAGNGPWATTAEELGKKEHECRERFKQIKPADWRPNKGKSGNQKQGKQKGQKHQNVQTDAENKAMNDKDATANGGSGAPVEGAWAGWGNTANNGATQENNNGWSGENGADDGWGGATSGNGYSGGGENKSNNGNSKDGGGFDSNKAWDNTNIATDNAQKQNPPKQVPSNKPSSKPPSQPESKPCNHRPSNPPPAEYELTPDSTFSANDLRVIARILQQDCQLVWNRVSWRFKDKTGRTVHPDVFEKKVTGRVEGKGSEHSGRQ
ncbi:hypothetical protein SVAN01_03927 [Stagonosporopsis vannaccii]|nr:hypothetical protein SVAN01_03927 [Stagonosporopsis vannaccii]